MPYFVEKLQKYAFFLKNICTIQKLVVILQRFLKTTTEIRIFTKAKSKIHTLLNILYNIVKQSNTNLIPHHYEQRT